VNDSLMHKGGEAVILQDLELDCHAQVHYSLPLT